MTRVLVVEDDPLIAMMLADWLGELGCVAAGPAGSEAEAFALLEAPVDAAILDVSLADGDSSGVAAELRARGVPFAFASGHGAAGVPTGFEETLLLPKPYDFDSFERVLNLLLSVS